MCSWTVPARPPAPYRQPRYLSDCQPIVADGKVVWYATGSGYDKSLPVFYTIDAASGAFSSAVTGAPVKPHTNLRASRLFMTGSIFFSSSLILFRGRYLRPFTSPLLYHNSPQFASRFNKGGNYGFLPLDVLRLPADAAGLPVIVIA